MATPVVPSYIFSMDAVPSVAAANNYLSLFNPADSDKLVILSAVFISSILLNPSSVANSLRGYRISDSTGGVLQPSSAIGKVQTKFPNPTIEIRTDNPTVVLGAPIFNSPAPVDNRASNVHEVSLPATGAVFTLEPGGGVVLRSEAGAGAGGTWNISVVWAEA